LVKTFLLSWLSRQHDADDAAAFEQARPGPWLVWEVGPWLPPPADRNTIPPPGERGHASSTDPLVLEVAPRPGRARFEGVRLGRGRDNDLVVDDGTLSRRHLLLRQEGDGWTIEDLRSSNGTRVDGEPLGGTPVPLPPGTRIQAGSVHLTFLDARGLRLRLKRAVM
jgi:hypothetical protein